jgi:hypothetical protein
MRDVPAGLHEQYEALVEELLEMGAFRRGTVTERYRKCGRPRCACARKAHPGHGPQTMLTYKERGMTRTVNLPSAAAVEMVRGQVEEHEHFLDWTKRWRTLQETISGERLKETVTSSKDHPTESSDDARKKKLRRASRRKSRGKSKRS